MLNSLEVYYTYCIDVCKYIQNVLWPYCFLFDNQSQHCWTCLDSKIKVSYSYIGPLVHVYLILLDCFGLWTRKMLYSLDKYVGNYRPSGITFFIELMKIKGIVQGDVCQSQLKTFRMLRLFGGLCSLNMFDINNIHVIDICHC